MDKFSAQHAPDDVPSITSKSSGIEYDKAKIEPSQPQGGEFPKVTKNEDKGSRG
jgi:hypothetical protein